MSKETKGDQMTAQNRCGNCAFWGRHPTDPELTDEYPDGFRWCTAVIHGNGDDIPIDGDYERILAPYKAVVTDGSGYSATLRTREDFACILFKQYSGGPDE